MRGLVCAVGSVIIASSAGAVTFSRVADTSMNVPGTSDAFTGFAPTGVNYDGSNVSFLGGNASVGGAYAGIGSSLTTLVDTNTPLPSPETGNVGYFGGVNLRGNQAVFEGGKTSTTPEIFTVPVGDGLTRIADTHTTTPGGSLTFTGFSNLPAANYSGAVAFIGSANHAAGREGGIYTTLGGSLRAIADLNSTLPGGSTTFTSFAVPDMKSNVLAYGGSSSTETGLYLYNAFAPPTIVVNNNTPIPNGTGNFTFVGSPSIDSDNDVAFRGSGSADSGIYAVINNQVIRIADRNSAAPGGGFFQSFDATAPSISGGDVVFEATRSFGANTYHGLYISADGVISKIVETGDELIINPASVHTIASIGALSADSFDGDSVAFYASSSDGYQGIFLATVPEPRSAILLLPGAILLMRRRRRARA
jgi:hypothetical protein